MAKKKTGKRDSSKPYKHHELESARLALAKYKSKLKKMKGVTSVGIGLKEAEGKTPRQRGQAKEKLAIVVYVEHKPQPAAASAGIKEKDLSFKAAYPRRKLIEKTLDGVQTDVRQVRKASYLANLEGAAKIARSNGGTQLSPAGSLGILVKDKSSKTVGITNAHVAFDNVNSNTPADILDVHQSTVIGRTGVNGFLRPGLLCDCATIIPLATTPVDLSVINGQQVIYSTNNSQANPDDPVKVIGANSGLTLALVDLPGGVTVDVGGVRYDDCMELKHPGRPFVVGGDSGSIILSDEPVPRSIGLLFAIDDNNPSIFFAFSLKQVNKKLGIG
jgi:hypothetical protein